MYTVLKLFKRQFPKILNERVSEEETKKSWLKKRNSGYAAALVYIFQN